MADKPSSQDFPHRLGGYQLLLPIGTGGMGGVYLAEREILPGVKRRYAVKLMHPRLRAEEGVSELLLHEARVVAAVEHPNVVSLVEAGEHGGDVFLVMDYVEGATLSSLIRAAIKAEEPVPLPVVGRILSDALAGLHAAHEATDLEGKALELVHRDFSPQNLLVGLDGITRLTDFGIAKVLSQLGATATGIVKGKTSYLAPEQASGARVDRRTDLWAAGVVLWETLTSRRLFKGEHDAAIILEVVSGGPVPPPSALRPECGAEIDGVLSLALRRDPARRATDALELRGALEAAWQPHGLADHLAVGAYVEKVVGRQLERRRAQAAEVIALRSKLGKLSDSAGRAAAAATAGLDSSSSSMPVTDVSDGDDRQVTTTTGTAAAHRLRASARRPLPLVVAALGVAAVGVIAYLAWPPAEAGDAPPLAADSSAPPAAASAESAAATASPDGTAGNPARATAAARLSLELEANAPIAQLRVQGRDPVVLAEPVKSMQLALRDEERQGPLTIRAVAADGRKAEVIVEVGQTYVAIRFLDKDRPAPRVVRPPPAASKRPEDPGLAPSPYQSKP